MGHSVNLQFKISLLTNFLKACLPQNELRTTLPQRIAETWHTLWLASLANYSDVYIQDTKYHRYAVCAYSQTIQQKHFS